VQPLLWMTVFAAKFAALTACSMDLPATICDRKPPTNASPAPFVSTSLSFGSLMTSWVVTCEHAAEEEATAMPEYSQQCVQHTIYMFNHRWRPFTLAAGRSVYRLR